MARGTEIDKIRLDKQKGQYILKDENVIHRQIEYAKLTGDETVLEIGPGLGALTFKLAKKANKVLAIEKDLRMYSHLKDRIPKNVTLVHADGIEYDFPDFDVVVSNLPYQISSPITFKLLKYKFLRAVLMYQREFADRMMAKCGDKNYSRLSVNVYFYADCHLLEHVSRSAFQPAPEIDSALIELIPRKLPFSVKSDELFFEVVKALFNERRKKIKNSIAPLVEANLRKGKSFNKSALKEIIRTIPYLDERVEVLCPEKIGEIADILHDIFQR
jgi:16S rRNA (adenine1518-N6/adenine1519-N6)-dimethyltransferase